MAKPICVVGMRSERTIYLGEFARQPFLVGSTRHGVELTVEFAQLFTSLDHPLPLRFEVVDKDGEFIEMHVHASLEACEQRDPKGLYAKARAGVIKDFTGIDSPYEAPERPELVIDTEQVPVEACVDRVLAYLSERRILRGA